MFSGNLISKIRMVGLYFFQICVVLVLSYTELDITVPLSGSAFLHYDWVICTDTINLVYTDQPYSNLSGHHQIEFVKTKDFSKFVKKRIFAKRMGIFILPSNLTQLEGLISDVAAIYDVKSNPYFDPRLYTFIRWPEATNNEKEVLAKIQKMFSSKFYLNSEVYIMYHPSNDQFNFSLMAEVFSMSTLTILQSVDPCWNWKNFDCYAMSKLGIRRSNLNQALIKVTSVNHPWDHLTTRYSKINGTLAFSGGIAVQLMWDLRDYLNFTVQALVADDYISETSDGELGGLGAQIYSGEADLGISPSYYLVYRVKKLTPLLPLMMDKMAVFFRQPRASRNLYTSPFTLSVWMVIFSIVFLVLFSTYIFAWMGYPVHRKYKGEGWASEESVLWLISVVCQKSWYFNPPAVSRKLLTMIALLAALICSAAYSGAFIAGLAVENPPIKSFMDLVSHGFQFLFNSIVYYRYFKLECLPSSEVEGYAKSSNLCTKDENGVLKVFQGGFAFVTTEDVFGAGYLWANYTDREMCSMISRVPYGKVEVPGGFYVQKGSPFKEVFNLKLLQLMERGINYRYWELIYARAQVRCLHRKTQYRGGLRLDDVSSTFIFVIIGLPLALGILGVELFIHTHRFKRFPGVLYLVSKISTPTPRKLQ